MTSLINSKQSKGLHLTNEQIKIILSGCMFNERAAQKELYSHYFGYVMSIALRYGSNYNDAVEITNDVFLEIYRNLNFFLPRSDSAVTSFTGWLKKIVVNTSIDYIRKYRKRGELWGGKIEPFAIADTQETVEQMLQHKDIINCIQRLPRAYKAVFNLYVIEGFSHVEIANKLNISEGTSKSNLHRARQNLQQLLKKSNLISYETTQCTIDDQIF